MNGLRLAAYGPEVFAEDRRLFGVLADMAGRAWEGQQLANQAALAEQLAETDRVRAGLLTAVGHDLRTPLAGIKAASRACVRAMSPGRPQSETSCCARWRSRPIGSPPSSPTSWP